MQKSQSDSFFTITFSRPRVAVSAELDISACQSEVESVGNPLVARLAEYVEVQPVSEDFSEFVDIDGAIVKSDAGIGAGLSAQEVLRHDGHLAMISEVQLGDDVIRRHFLTQIYAFAELRELKGHLLRAALGDFQRRHKHVLLTYDQEKMRALGTIAAGPKSVPVAEAYENYVRLFKEALSEVPTHESWANSVEHMFGHFKEKVSTAEKVEFLTQLAQYRAYELPLEAVLVMIRTWCERYAYHYFADQTLLEPYPAELGEALVEIKDVGC